MLNHLRSIVPIAALALGLGQSAQAQEWPRFRGPNGSGLGDPVSIPNQWTDKTILWKVELPGTGHSSPVIAGQRIFVTCGDKQTGKRMLVCLDTAGKTLWTREFASQTYRMHADNSYGTASPAVDTDAVYFAWTTPTSSRLVALTHAGADLWQADLGPYVSQHGSGASPIVFEDLVIQSFDQEGQPSFVIAFDRKTGQQRWKTPRTTGSSAYGTPCIYTAKDGSPQLILSSRMDGVTALDPRTGQLIWQMPKLLGKRVVASPIVAGDLVLANCGEGNSGQVLVAVRPGTKTQQPTVAWKLSVNPPYVPTPLCKGDRLYLLTDTGTASCHETATGKRLGEKSLSAPFYGSFVCAGDRLFAISRRGDLFILSASDTPQLLAKNPLGEPSFATPAIAHGRMYLRTATHLLCVGAAQ